MKQTKYQYAYRSNSSKLHLKVGEVLRNPNNSFSNFRIYQEYPVKSLVSTYSNSRHRFDWVILDLQLVIECHGKQHFVKADFGGKRDGSEVDNLKAIQERDLQKKNAAIEAGYTYIVIPYSDIKIIDEKYIWDLYEQEKNTQPFIEETKIEKVNLYKEKQKELARLYRQKQYQKYKQFKQKGKDHG